MKILLLGGLGVVGRIITPALLTKYEVLISDIKEEPPNLICQYLQIDVSNFSQLIDRVPKDIDVIVNLTALPQKETIPNEEEFCLMRDVYITGSYNVFLAAASLRIGKVIFASTNHASGSYEENGQSTLGREININDPPLPDSVYGAMKLCAEQFGRLFSTHFGMSVICLRIATVVANEYEFLLVNERARHTILGAIDTVDIFIKSIDSKIKYGVYHVVSDNPGKPWSIQEAIEELGYTSKTNSNTILKSRRLSK